MLLNSMLEKEVTTFEVMEAYFIQALYWSLGAGLLEDGRIKFDAYIKNLAALTPKDDTDEKEYAVAGKPFLSFSFQYIKCISTL